MSKKARRAEEILRSAGIFDEVKMKESLMISIAKSAIRDKSMDRDTVIYRLAMMIYHSEPLAGCPIIDTVEDPGYIYLRLMEDPDIANLLREKFERSIFVGPETFIKTFICFAIASYIYTKARS